MRKHRFSFYVLWDSRFPMSKCTLEPILGVWTAWLSKFVAHLNRILVDSRRGLRLNCAILFICIVFLSLLGFMTVCREIDREEFRKVMALMASYNRQGTGHRDGRRLSFKARKPVENGGLLRYFFGEDGSGRLTHDRFIQFLRDLHDEVFHVCYPRHRGLKCTYLSFRFKPSISLELQ